MKSITGQTRTEAIAYFCRKYQKESNVFTISEGIVGDIYELKEEGLFKTVSFIPIIAHYLAGLPQLHGKGKILEMLIKGEVEKMQASLLTNIIDMGMPIPVQLFKDKKGDKVLATSDNLAILCKCYGIDIVYEELNDIITLKFGSNIPKELAKAKLEDLLALNGLPTSLTNRVHLVSMKYKSNPLKEYLDYPREDKIDQIASLGLTPLETKFLGCFARQVLLSVETGGLLDWVFTGEASDYEKLFPEVDSSAIWKQISSLELGLSKQATTKVTRMFLGKNIEVNRRQNLLCKLTAKQIINFDYKIIPMDVIINKLLTVDDKQLLWGELAKLAEQTNLLSKNEIVGYLLEQRVNSLSKIKGKDFVQLSHIELARNWDCVAYSRELAFALTKKFVIGFNNKWTLPREF